MTLTKKQLAYTDQGTGDCLVLIHGFCEAKEMWDHLIPSLIQHYRVIALDLAGFGASEDCLEENMEIDDLARQVQDLLQILVIKKYTLIGHSLGGYVALSFAQQYPEKLAGLGWAKDKAT